MVNLQKTKQELATIISEDLLKICGSELDLEYRNRVESARQTSETQEQFDLAIQVLDQQKALARADICDEWIARCNTPVNTRKELARVTTLDGAMKLMSPSLYTISKRKGDKYVTAYIKMWLVDLQGNLNIKNKLSEEMINIASDTILTQYGVLTIADLKNVLTDALNGVYGEFYESLSVPKVLSWFAEYFERRCEAYASNYQSDHAYFKGEATGWKTRERKAELSERDLIEINKARDGK